MDCGLYINNVLIASDITASTYLASSLPDRVRLANRPNNNCANGAVGLQTAFLWLH